jgi:hypothetical protein
MAAAPLSNAKSTTRRHPDRPKADAKRARCRRF